jgi:chemotaxis protein CheZ
MSSAPFERAAAPTLLDGDARVTLQRFGEELPDACERLSYVRQMTERAADKVLTLIDVAQDDAEKVHRQGTELSEALLRLAAAPELSPERARAMMRLCAGYASTAASFAAREKSLHTELMMAQDFQDLSGQVINRVIGMLQRSAEPVAQVLAATSLGEAPQAREPVADVALEGVQTPDKALQQEDVDDLLASLGF